jgi:hypothetical protein
MTTAQHLEWLLSLMEPPYTQGWKAHCWRRAQELEKDHPGLTAALAAAMTKKPSSEKPSEQRGTE